MWSEGAPGAETGARDSIRAAALALRDRARDAVRIAADSGRLGAQRLRVVGANALGALPPQALPELTKAVGRLRKVRTPRQAVDAFEAETERLLTVITPTLVEHPLPVRSTAAAKSIVATAGGLAAAGEEAEEIAAFVSGGAAVVPTLPIVLAANLVALAIEVYVAASLRVHDLREAGLEPDPQEVARDVVDAMTGRAGDERGIGGQVTKRMVRSIVSRVLSRWSAAFVPVAGIAYSGWDAQRTVDAVRALPLPLRPSNPVPAS